MTYSRGKKPALIASGLFAAIPFLAFVWLWSGPYTETIPRFFNSDGWKDADLDGTTRCGMILDLKYRIGIVGKMRSEINAFLGKPEQDRINPNISYWLLCPSFIDIWVLDVKWENRRAASASIHDT